jgi:hypothetical protein
MIDYGQGNVVGFIRFNQLLGHYRIKINQK